MIEKTSVAVIGMGGSGRAMLQALQGSKMVEVVGLSEREPLVAERAGKEFGVRWFADNRRLLIEANPRIVFLAVPPASCPDIVDACAGRGVHVWKELPLARNLRQGVAMVRRMESADLKFAVGTQRRFAAGYARAWQLRNRVGRIFLARACYLFNWGGQLGWRGDRETAGGGVLLELGYHCVDLLVWLLGFPEEVFCRCACNKPDNLNGSGQVSPPHDTDDTTAAVLQYADECMAGIVTTRSSGPVSEELSLHGSDGSLTADGATCLLRDPDGNVLDRLSDQPPPVELYRRQAEAFVQAVTTNAERYQCSARENLLNMAIIDAMYLSAQTRQPENPSRLLHTNALTIEACLTNRPRLEDKG